MSDKVRGAGSEGGGSNPTVHSKFDRSHGKGLKAPHLSHPGEVAKETGSGHSGFTEHGHMMPREAKMGHGGHSVTHHAPGDSGSGGKKNYLMTDSIASETKTDSP